EILELEQVSVTADFFELGGHSLKAIRLLSQIGRQMGVSMSFQDFVLHYSTIRQQWNYIKTQSQSEQTPITPVAEASDYALSPAQQRMWSITHLSPDQRAYNMQGAFRMQGALNVHLLESAMWAMEDQHESLRTNFREVEGEIRQFIHPKGSRRLKMQYRDLKLQLDSQTILQNGLEEMNNLVYDLSTDALVNLKVWQIEAEEYIVGISMHHIISDAFSLQVFAKELGEVYMNLRNGKSAYEAALPIQYKDYTAWINEQTKSASFQEQERYWKELFAGDVPNLELPTDFSRPPIQTYEGSVETTPLSTELVEGLRALVKDRQISMYSILIASVNAYLYRISGQSDLVVGIPAAGRNHPDLENQIGLYINTLALRTNIEEDENFEGLLQKVRANVLSGYENQSYPFDWLVDSLDMERDLSRTPLFNVWVQFIEKDVNAGMTLALDQIEISNLELPVTASKFDLSFYLEETTTGYDLKLEYNTDLFKASTIRHLMSLYQHYLLEMLRLPTAHLGRLKLMAKPETIKMLSMSTGIDAMLPETTFVSCFEASAAYYKDQTALNYLDRSHTYASLNEQANQLAHFIKAEFDVQAEQVIGLMMDRSDRYIISMLAALKAGAAFLPLDPALPSQRLRYMLKQANAQIVLTDQEEALNIEEVTAVNIVTSNYEQYSNANLSLEISPDQLAYVLYTSGTTGKPKGAMVEHRGMLNHLLAKIEDFSLNEASVMAQTASISFDISIWQGLVCLLSGGRTQVYDKELVLWPSRMIEAIEQDGVTVLEVVPSYMNELLASLENEAATNGFATLDCLIATGEALKYNQVERWFQLFPSKALGNVYGPTEASDDVTHCIMHSLPEEQTVSIGTPIRNTRVYILDEHDQLCPVGVKGEICVAGPCVGRGYIGDAERTAKAFGHDPYGYISNRRLYRTGDIGSYRADGQIDFFGRKDHQIKLRGHRIELGEIEEQLAKLDGVGQCAVVVKDNQYLLAYVEAKNAVELQPTELEQALRQILPAYMLPDQVIELETLPLTNNGKINRRKLSERSIELIRGEYVAPANEAEARLQALWQEVLEQEQISVTTDFFELGGHSLKAIRLLSNIRQQMGVELSFQDFVLNHSSIRQQWNYIRTQRQSQQAAIPTVAEAADYPLSPAQMRMWSITQLSPDQRAYNMQGAFVMEGALNVETLVQAVWSLEDRHESLRTNFKEVDGEVRQLVQAEGSRRLQLQYSDLRGHTDAQAKLQQALETAADTVYDLSKDALVQLYVWQLEAEVFTLCISMHHIISDALSLQVFSKELGQTYANILDGKDAYDQEASIQYKDYTAWLNERMNGENFKKQEQYWLDQFQGELPKLELPTDFSRPPIQTYEGAVESTTLSAGLTKRLKQLVKDQKVSMYSLLVATVDAYLYRISGQSDIVVGIPVAGRNHPDLEQQIGLYINTLALRTQIDPEDNLTSLLQKVKANILNGYENQNYPFDWLVDALEMERDFSRTPLFNVWVQFIEAGADAAVSFGLNDLKVSELELPVTASKFDLSFYLEESADDLELRLEYNTDLFRPQTINKLMKLYTAFVEKLLAQPAQPITEHRLLDAQDTQELLALSTGTQCCVPEESFIRSFERHVLEHPNWDALQFGDKVYAYAELNDMVNRLAHLLICRYSIGREEVVGVMMERSDRYVVTILAILKAGGAFLPIDTGLPSDRIQYMLKQAGVKTVMTENGLGLPCRSCECIAFREEDWADMPSFNPDTIIDENQLAYVIFTSGTTGRPKGAMIQHKGMLNHLFAKVNDFGIDQKSTVAQTASISFDISVWQALVALLRGGKTIVYPQSLILNPEELLQSIDRDRVSIWEVVPSYLNELLNLLESQSNRPALQALRCLMATGEALKKNLVERWFQLFPNIPMGNVYGPTEASDDVTHLLLDCVPDGTSISIGKPVQNMRVFILDDFGQLCPIGVKGEICIAGIGVGKGYINNEEKTQAAFQTDPTNFLEDAKMYRTGDLGCYRADGTIDFYGRKDYQVKIRGHRIELGEIEEQLARIPFVQESAVIVREEEI
ncbi:MAG: amino acid adenylation domain-containing protein, partial [Bacteroidota bacterium]